VVGVARRTTRGILAVVVGARSRSATLTHVLANWRCSRQAKVWIAAAAGDRILLHGAADRGGSI